MTATGFATFDTAIGRCALVWRGAFVVGVALPEGDEPALRAHLASRFPLAREAVPGGAIADAIGAVAALLSGAQVDLAPVEVDLAELAVFERHVLAATRAIPRGEVRTYGEIARAIGSPGAARAVGRTLGRNPIPIIIPCHRVLAAGGRSGGFSAPGGTSTKFRLLAIEGARRKGDPGLFDHLPLATRPPL